MNERRPLPPDLEPGADAGWLDAARRRLDESAQELDAASLSRLNRARQRALAEQARRPRAAWYWSAALTGAAALALGVALWRAPVSGPAPAPLQPQDFELVAGEDGFELYEDLEFYAWLDAQQVDG